MGVLIWTIHHLPFARLVAPALLASPLLLLPPQYVLALDMSAADHTPGALGPAATAAEPAPETTTPTPSTPLLFTADMDTVADPKLDTMMTNLMPTSILDMLMQTTDLADGLSLEYEAGQESHCINSESLCLHN